MKPGMSGKKGGKHSEKRIMPTIKIKCARIAHFIFCPIKNTSESILKKNGKFALQKGVDMIRKYGIVKV